MRDGDDARGDERSHGSDELLLWHAGESLYIAPDFLAYFNELDGGPGEAYKHLVDSSLDWGQDLPGLKAWLDASGTRVEEGPVPRPGGRQAQGTSTYIRDPDGNLLEFMIYG